MLTDDAFARLVAEDVKNRVTQEQRDYLRLPENRAKWDKALVSLIENLAEQIDELVDKEERDVAQFEAYGEDGGDRLILEAKLSYGEKRQKITRFKFYVESRLAEVHRLTALGDEAIGGEMRLSSFLRKAIHAHKAFITEWDIEPSEIDEALWAALDGEWKFSDLEAYKD